MPSNSLFERFGGKAPASAPQVPQNPFLDKIRDNPKAFVGEIKANPANFVRRCGYNIPDGMNDPRQIIGYLFGFGGRGG